MRSDDSGLETVTGVAGVLMGVGFVMFMVFPLALPIIALTVVATIPLALPIAVIALVGCLAGGCWLGLRAAGRRARSRFRR